MAKDLGRPLDPDAPTIHTVRPSDSSDPTEAWKRDLKIIAREGWAARFLFHSGFIAVKKCQTCLGYRRVFRRFAPMAWERSPCRCD